MRITLRPAGQADLLPIQNIERLCFDGSSLWRRIGRPGASAWVAVDDDGRVTGYVIAFPRRLGLAGYGAVAPYVGEIGVAPQARRGGIGRALMQAVIAHYGRAWLHVRAGNTAALGLYHALGFAIIGRRRRFYPDGADALVLMIGL